MRETRDGPTGWGYSTAMRWNARCSRRPDRPAAQRPLRCRDLSSRDSDLPLARRGRALVWMLDRHRVGSAVASGTRAGPAIELNSMSPSGRIWTRAYAPLPAVA
jgi:hypothetical protein